MTRDGLRVTPPLGICDRIEIEAKTLPQPFAPFLQPPTQVFTAQEENIDSDNRQRHLEDSAKSYTSRAPINEFIHLCHE
jgi:hypothetical protein